VEVQEWLVGSAPCPRPGMDAKCPQKESHPGNVSLGRGLCGEEPRKKAQENACAGSGTL
jgi:hypothetical protein